MRYTNIKEIPLAFARLTPEMEVAWALLIDRPATILVAVAGIPLALVSAK